jgi:hypothetical protein
MLCFAISQAVPIKRIGGIKSSYMHASNKSHQHCDEQLWQWSNLKDCCCCLPVENAAAAAKDGSAY